MITRPRVDIDQPTIRKVKLYAVRKGLTLAKAIGVLLKDATKGMRG